MVQRNASSVAAGEVVYTTKSLWAGDIDHALVVDCNDPRMPGARDEFLRQYCRISRYDPLFGPGGPVILTFANPSCFVDHERVRFLHGIHKFQRVIGIVHYGCAYYREKYPHANESERYVHQVADLHNFVNEMKRLTPGAVVELYYAGPDDDNFVEYKRIV